MIGTVPMQAVSVHRLPMLPYAEVLSHSPVPAAGYVTQDAIKQELLQWLCAIGAPTLRGGDLDNWINGRIEVGHHERWAGKTGGLMNEEMRAFVVAVVGNEET
jgi:hypothetical protein